MSRPITMKSYEEAVAVGEIITLHPDWGYKRIQSECAARGLKVSGGRIRTILDDRLKRPRRKR